MSNFPKNMLENGGVVRVTMTELVPGKVLLIVVLLLASSWYPSRDVQWLCGHQSLGPQSAESGLQLGVCSQVDQDHYRHARSCCKWWFQGEFTSGTGIKVLASLRSIEIMKHIHVALSVPPSTHRPSTRRWLWYFHFLNLLSSTSTTFPEPLIGYWLSSQPSHTSQQKLCQSVTVLGKTTKFHIMYSFIKDLHKNLLIKRRLTLCRSLTSSSYVPLYLEAEKSHCFSLQLLGPSMNYL